MERIKIQKNFIVPFIISFVLFLIPFFWFKPGEMDLGGDSSRLYFYDPISYLSKATLYVVSPSSYGADYLGYSNIPFISFLIILKSIIVSPTILICMFYGISLSGAFLFTYLAIKELLDTKNSWLAATVGGLLYVFSPVTLDGWKHVLITYNHVFLSPLIFYLLLRYFKTSQIRYILGTILITFLFSPNFSVAAAPALFSFYPLSILFLIVYTKLILKRKIVIKHIVLALILFTGIQAFHLFPVINSIFSQGNDIHATIFSDKGKFDRGLSYFLAVSSNIKASINLFSLPQTEDASPFLKVFIIFPFIIVIALIFNRKKAILLSAVFFIIILFFVTANITDIWFFIYKSLFSVPGFSMFRNFHSQWVYTYLFFYALLFGQTFFVVANKLNKIYRYIMTFLLIAILTINAWPLIKGEISNELLWQSNKVKSVFQMDPDFEKALSYVRSLPADAKVLTLPLTDPGYQIIGGKNEGAYMGPSTISYLVGKKDFAGYDEFLDYKHLILQLIRDKDYDTLKRVLGILNVRYVFYNADPVVYNEFPTFPYEQVRNYLPKDQKTYKQFISDLNLKQIKNINNTFFVFELSDEYFSPHINIVEKSISINNPINNIKIPRFLYEASNRISFFSYTDEFLNSQKKNGISLNSNIIFDENSIDITKNNSYADLTASLNESLYEFPYVSWSMGSPLYPYIVMREKKELESYGKIDQLQIDRTIFLAEKRIAELEKWGNDTKLAENKGSIHEFDKVWEEPSLLPAIVFQKYNYWEVNLLRYYRILNKLISKIESESTYEPQVSVNKYRINRKINKDREIVYRVIQDSENLTVRQKLYLLKLSVEMFSSIEKRLSLDTQLLDIVDYNLSALEKGDYEIYIEKKIIEDYSQSGFGVVVNNRQYFFDELKQEQEWFKIPFRQTDKKEQNNFRLLIPSYMNLTIPTKWKSFEKENLGTNSASLIINDDSRGAAGIMREISTWQPNAYYFVSFEYKTNEKRLKLVVFDRQTGKNKKRSNLLDQELKSKKWKSYKSVVLSTPESNSGYIQFLKSAETEIFNKFESGERATQIDIRNVSVVKIPTPKIIVRKIHESVEKKQLPSVTFTRVNPAKYIVKIQNAKDPFTLVLVDQYNTNWKLVDPTQDTNTIRGFFARIIGKIGKAGVAIFSMQAIDQTKEVLRYFDGKVNQTVNQDIFLDTQTFDTWGKDSVADYKHFPVNGYANAWYIEPKDMQGKTDYTLVIEMTSQKMLYAGLFLSVATFFVVVLLLAKTFFKK